nr:MAG TPA: hypothetical protein [Caudoviricetes sp.]
MANTQTKTAKATRATKAKQAKEQPNMVANRSIKNG